MIKVAETKADFRTVVDLAMKFAAASPYAKYVELEAMQKMVVACMNNDDSVVLLDEEGRGMLMATIVPFIYGSKRVAIELGWWVNPEDRNSGIGRDLINLFESWALVRGCQLITMISIDDQMGPYYEKRGYELRERTYMKEL